LVGTEEGPKTGSDVWTLDPTLEGGWREARLYEVTLAPPPPAPEPAAEAPAEVPAEAPAEPVEPVPEAPWATVTWSVGSPVPGDWTRQDVVAVRPVALVDAEPFL